MRRMILPLMLLAAVACQPATMELTDDDKAVIADEVNAINAEFWEVWRAADFDRGVSYFDSADFVFAYEGAVDYGLATFDAKWRPMYANVASQTITLTDSRTIVLAPDVVCIMEVGTFTATDTLGVISPEGSFAMMSIWMRRDGEWKIHLAHESLPTPEAEST